MVATEPVLRRCCYMLPCSAMFHCSMFQAMQTHARGSWHSTCTLWLFRIAIEHGPLIDALYNIYNIHIYIYIICIYIYMYIYMYIYISWCCFIYYIRFKNGDVPVRYAKSGLSDKKHLLVWHRKRIIYSDPVFHLSVVSTDKNYVEMFP